MATELYFDAAGNAWILREAQVAGGPVVPAAASIADVDSAVAITVDATAVSHPSAFKVTKGGNDPGNFDLPATTLVVLDTGASTTVTVTRSAATGGNAGDCSVDFELSNGNTVSTTVTAAAVPPPPPFVRWLEVRMQFDQYSSQASDFTMIELRSGIVGSFGGASPTGPDQTTGVPIAPIAMGIYPDYVTYNSLTTTNIYPDPSIAPPTVLGPAMMTAPLANAFWPELPAGSTQNESIITASGSLDVVVFFGILATGTGYSLAVKENLGSFTGFPEDPNVTVHMRVWDQDPLSGAAPLWASGLPPADQAVSPVTGVLYPGTAPYNTAPPNTSSVTFPTLPFVGLPDNGSGPVTNGWSLWALSCDYGGGSVFTHDGIQSGTCSVGTVGHDADPITCIAAGHSWSPSNLGPRVYHVDDVQAGSTFGGAGGATHPGINGTFEIL